MVVSGEQWRDSAIYTHVSILPQTPLPSRLALLKKNLFIYFWLQWVLVVARGSFIATHRLFSGWGRQDPECVGSAVVAHGISGSAAYGILVARREVKSMSPSLESEFLSTYGSFPQVVL